MKGLLSVLAKRYIAGETINDAINAARRLSGDGILAAIDNLGENVRDEKASLAAVREYLRLLDDIICSGVNAMVSVKLTQLGLDISDELAFRNASAIAAKALSHNNFVWIDMESSAYTQRTIDLVLRLRRDCPNVGVAIQSSLMRSRADLRLLVDNHVSVRLVKGAYKEPHDISFKEKKDVDRNFDTMMRELLIEGNRPAIATHDERLIEGAISFATEHRIPPKDFEFQMLLGIKRSLQKKLASKGFTVRVYIPYGTNWLPYTIRRLTERKENVFFVLKNIFD